MEFQFEEFETELEDFEVNKVGKFKRIWSATEGGSIVRTSLMGDKLYWGSFDGYVYALDIENKKLLWKTKFGAMIDSSPVCSKGFLYIGDREGNFYCIRASNGKIIWRYRMGGAMAGYAGVRKGIVYTSCQDSNFYAFDAKTGEVIWKFKTGEEMCSTPGFYENTVIFGSFDGYAYCVDAKTGEEKWRFKTGAEVFDPVHLTIHEGIVYIPSFDSYLYALKAKTGEEIWKAKLGNYGVAMSPTIEGERIYIGARDGNLYCLDMNGKEIWRFRTGGVIESKAVVKEERIYFGSEDGNLYSIDLQGNEIWRFKVDGQIWDEPKIYKDLLIFGAVDCRVHYLDLETGKELWNIQISTLRKSIWSHPYEMFKVEIKKEIHIDEPVSEEKYKKKKEETVSLSDYQIESEYTTESDYKQKGDYSSQWVLFEGVLEVENIWTLDSRDLKPRVSIPR
ncbi:MAG: PQQ-binding-like beta-propeller repeat protein [Candidatus Aenigmarchaeota archaeon]|nr:PQQ-binding-like beta-propeller repeat protein [Candidatus Aenigmarchaeota archaeon]